MNEYSGGDLSKILEVQAPFSLRHSSFLPFPLMDSLGGLGRAHSLAVKQSYKIHIDV